ncbi:AraC family transcriptional regulator [Paenibacillus cisolokensis]|uniref:AraC family transcriptional regulator n=1 Tax=Paenibacillus cisolokensis TaxID=1658519 RepID=UPI003D2CFAC7
MSNRSLHHPVLQELGSDSGLMARLRHMEIYNGRCLQLDQQLTVHPALVLLLGGEASLLQAEQTTRMVKGCVYGCPAGSTFGVQGDGQLAEHEREQTVVAILHFGLFASLPGSDEWKELDAAAVLPENGVFTYGSPERLQQICRSVYRHVQDKDPLRKWRGQLDFQRLLYTLIAESSPDTRHDKRQALKRVKEYMNEHYDQDLSMDQLAELADLSPKYFVEVFKKTYGYSAMDYLGQVRMKKAKQLMLGSDSLLKEVAHSVGYKDEFYFSRKFKKAFGLSPSEYMRTHKNKVAMYGSTTLLGYAMPLQWTPYAAPLHPKWSQHYYNVLGPDIPVHLDAYRQNHNRTANLEKLAAARPELIICASGVETWEKEELRRIAPLYEMPGQETCWRRSLLDLAEVLNRKAEAVSWLAAYERTISGWLEQLPSHTRRKRRILTARLHRHELAAYSHPGIREVLYEYLEFEPVVVPEEANNSLSIRQIEESCPGHLLLLVRQDSETLAYWRQLESSPEWMALDTVRSGTFRQLSSYPWREYSPIAMEQMAEEALRMFSGKYP